jgi:hypothetical protein
MSCHPYQNSYLRSSCGLAYVQSIKFPTNFFKFYDLTCTASLCFTPLFTIIFLITSSAHERQKKAAADVLMTDWHSSVIPRGKLIRIRWLLACYLIDPPMKPSKRKALHRCQNSELFWSALLGWKEINRLCRCRFDPRVLLWGCGPDQEANNKLLRHLLRRMSLLIIST